MGKKEEERRRTHTYLCVKTLKQLGIYKITKVSRVASRSCKAVCHQAHLHCSLSLSLSHSLSLDKSKRKMPNETSLKCEERGFTALTIRQGRQRSENKLFESCVYGRAVFDIYLIAKRFQSLSF